MIFNQIDKNVTAKNDNVRN